MPSTRSWKLRMLIVLAKFIKPALKSYHTNGLRLPKSGCCLPILKFDRKILPLPERFWAHQLANAPKTNCFVVTLNLSCSCEFDRCRKLYEKFLEFSPENCTIWMKFAEMEAILGDTDRARAIMELAIGQPRLEMPEVLWKAYIDFEMEQEEFGKTRSLYQRLLQRTKHVKVWLSYAQFELSVNDENSVQQTRSVYRQANSALKDCDEKEERLMLLEAWKEFEYEHGDDRSLAAVAKMMPNKVKRRRKIQTESGTDSGWEEYYDYIFPDDESAQPNLKLLAMAKMWKKQTEEASHNVEDDAADDDDEEEENLLTEDDLHPPEESARTSESDASDSDAASADEDDAPQQNDRTDADKDVDRDDSISSTSSDSSDSEDSDAPSKSRRRSVPRSESDVKEVKRVVTAEQDGRADSRSSGSRSRHR